MIPMPRLLGSGGGETRRLRPISLSLTENIVPLSTATMTLPADESVPDRSWMELFTVNGSAGVYRASMPQDVYGSPTTQVKLEHGVVEIGDYIIKADIEKTAKTLTQAMTQLFTYYPGSKWQFGTAISGDVTLEAKYGDNLLTTINKMVSQVSGAMLSYNFSTSPWTLNVVSKGTTVSAEGRLSRNVRSAYIKRDDSNLCTRVYMEGLGADGAIGYMDADTISTYGIVEKKIDGNSEYTQQEAQTVAGSYLAKYKIPSYSVSISGIDFSAVTGETLDRVALGKLYRLAVPEDNVSIEENIIQISWNDVYGNPEDVDLTLAEEEKTLVSIIKQKNEETKQDIEDSYTDCYNESKSYTNTAIHAEAERSDEKYIYKTSIYQTADSIVSTAQQYADGIGDGLQSQITQQANKIALVVEEVSGSNVINTASIVAAINASGSSVTISADKINLQGHVSITDLSEYSNGTLHAGNIFVETALQVYGDADFSLADFHLGRFISLGGGNYAFDYDYNLAFQDITINGTTYTFLVGT